MTTEHSRKWAILCVVTLVSFVTNVDATIVVIGLPKLIESLHITIILGMWTITSYLLTSTVFLLPAGRWADVVGTKRIFLLGFLLFTIATVLCGLSSSGIELVVFRFIQGVGAALSLATATPIIIRTFPPRQLGFAIGINSTSWVIGSIIGPVVGGALISEFGWRSIFFVVVPFTLIGIIAAWFLLEDDNIGTKNKTDWIGVLTFGLGLTTFLVGLSEGCTWGWSSGPIICLSAATIMLGILFISNELRVRDPFFNLRLLAEKPYTTGLGITLSYCIGYFSITILVTLYLQGAQHLNPLESGLLLIPLSAPQLIMGPLGGKLADRFGSARLIIVGVSFILFSFLLLWNLGGQLSIPAVVIPLIIISVANGFAWPSLAKAVLSAAPKDQAGAASGMFYTIYNVGRVISQTLALMLVEYIISPNIASKMFLGMGMGQNLIVNDALVHFTNIGFRFFAVFFFIALLISVILLQPHRVKKSLTD